ncbi:hypothetical protein [Microvirga pudoricolor]|uniref:hypothetical protein n=1 Tax=Microvirga pudoricolor TaxID=2778729 RepID=UPI00195282E0|nr:hypothetical protein [Microvirga pudoricolor]MBM6596770.1 hypothetical protein [Microvirga pudoricolor]
MPYPDSEDDIELSRQERLSDLRASGQAPRVREADRGEAIRVAAALMKAVDDGLAGNAAIVTDAELYPLAYRAFENLFELHRALGGRHSDAGPGETEGAGPRPAGRSNKPTR